MRYFDFVVPNTIRQAVPYIGKVYVIQIKIQEPGHKSCKGRKDYRVGIGAGNDTVTIGAVGQKWGMKRPCRPYRNFTIPCVHEQYAI